MENGDDPYEILGVPQNCDYTILRNAFVRLSVSTHPERKYNVGKVDYSINRFHKIANAYELLSNPLHRHIYDLHQRSPEVVSTKEIPRGYHAPSLTHTQYPQASSQYDPCQPGMLWSYRKVPTTPAAYEYDQEEHEGSGGDDKIDEENVEVTYTVLENGIPVERTRKGKTYTRSPTKKSKRKVGGQSDNDDSDIQSHHTFQYEDPLQFFQEQVPEGWKPHAKKKKKKIRSHCKSTGGGGGGGGGRRSSSSPSSPNRNNTRSCSPTPTRTRLHRSQSPGTKARLRSSRSSKSPGTKKGASTSSGMTTPLNLDESINLTDASVLDNSSSNRYDADDSGRRSSSTNMNHHHHHHHHSSGNIMAEDEIDAQPVVRRRRKLKSTAGSKGDSRSNSKPKTRTKSMTDFSSSMPMMSLQDNDDSASSLQVPGKSNNEEDNGESHEDSLEIRNLSKSVADLHVDGDSKTSSSKPKKIVRRKKKSTTTSETNKGKKSSTASHKPLQPQLACPISIQAPKRYIVKNGRKIAVPTGTTSVPSSMDKASSSTLSSPTPSWKDTSAMLKKASQINTSAPSPEKLPKRAPRKRIIFKNGKKVELWEDPSESSSDGSYDDDESNEE